MVMMIMMMMMMVIPVVFPNKSFLEMDAPVLEGSVKSGASCPTFGKSAATS
jgi:hypothetical protein